MQGHLRYGGNAAGAADNPKIGSFREEIDNA